MKKNGYTLAETLIALLIIGIMAAVVLPFVNKFKPDTTKISYLRCYDALVQATNAIVSGTEFFNSQDNNGNDHTKKPLENFDEARVDGKDFNGGKDNKMCQVLAYALNAFDNNTCAAEGYQTLLPHIENNANGEQENVINFPIAFTTSNGQQFAVETTILEPNNIYQTEVAVDINGDKGPNCLYTAETCTKPDRFLFLIAADGRVIPNDAMGIAYKNSRTSYKSNKSVEIDKEYTPKSLNDNSMQKYTQNTTYNDNSENPENENPESKVPADELPFQKIEYNPD